MDDERQCGGVEGGIERHDAYDRRSLDVLHARLQPDVHDQDGRSERHVLRVSRRQHDDPATDVPQTT